MARNLAGAQRPAQLGLRGPVQLAERVLERLLEARCGDVRVLLRPALRLRDDPVDHSELVAVEHVGLEGGGGLLLLVAVTPQMDAQPSGEITE